MNPKKKVIEPLFESSVLDKKPANIQIIEMAKGYSFVMTESKVVKRIEQDCALLFAEFVVKHNKSLELQRVGNEWVVVETEAKKSELNKAIKFVGAMKEHAKYFAKIQKEMIKEYQDSLEEE